MGIHKYIVITEKLTFDLKRGLNIFLLSKYLLKTTFYQNMWDYGLFASLGVWHMLWDNFDDILKKIYERKFDRKSMKLYFFLNCIIFSTIFTIILAFKAFWEINRRETARFLELQKKSQNFIEITCSKENITSDTWNTV